ILDDQGKLVHRLLPALEKARHDKIIEIIRSGEANLEKLGVVSPFAKKIIRDVEKSGGAAKICGAGGTTKSTGIILIYHTDLQILQKVLKSHLLNPYKLKLGVEGLKMEKN
ncbi:MAG: Mevalonate kinase, partial [Microgenomates group bacterium GW2011_GWA2_37_6]